MKKLDYKFIGLIGFILFSVSTLGFLGGKIFFDNYPSDDHFKKLLISNAADAKLVNEGTFSIYNNKDYFEKVTFSFIADSSYHVTCWGDRDSFWWNYRKDKSFSVSIPYNRYNNNDVELDVALVKTFNNLK